MKRRESSPGLTIRTGSLSETCIATGARISEVLGLQWKHVNLDAGTIKIEQRVWHQEVSHPKSEGSKRLLGIADLQERYRAKIATDAGTPESFVFQQKRAPGRPLWDSGVRDAVHLAAQEAENCAISEGLGPAIFHSRRARRNITWRQQVGGSAIKEKLRRRSRSLAETLEMTSEYTFVTAERQNELTHKIQEKLADAGKKLKGNTLTPSTPAEPEVAPGLADVAPASTLVQ